MILGRIKPEKGPAKRKTETAKRDIDAFQADTEAIQRAPDPRLARLTLHLLATLVAAAILWASIVKIERIVSASGRLVSSVPSLVVQPLETSIIRSIKVRTGDVVKPGQVLAELDPTFVDADIGQIRGKMDSALALIDRLEAEIADRPYRPGPDANIYEILQQALWGERQAQYLSQLRGYEERLRRSAATLEKHQGDERTLRSRLDVVGDIEKMRTSLADKQVGSRLNELVARDARLEIERNIALAESQQAEAGHEIQSIQAERDVYRQQWRARLHEDLVNARREEEAARAQVAKANRIQDLIELRASREAVVLNIADLSVGSVVKGADPMITLVPLDVPLEVEASIDARDLGFVRAGDKAQIKLEAFNYMEHGTLEGVVQTISEDAFTDPKDPRKAPYYRTRIVLGEMTLRNVPPTFRLIPGMPLVADINVGERTVISYFLRPILRGMGESFRDP